ncbi:MAG TPA: choice-of-anchor R domain-containing protein [Solirubrobacterales bacterium]
MAVVASLLVPNLAMAGTLDQEQPTVAPMALNAHSTQSVAQTFTAGLSGKLDQVDLNLNMSGSPPVPVIVDLRDASGGLPGSAILASQNVLSSDVVAFPGSGWVSFVFPTPAPVTAGTQYAIVAHSAAVFPETYAWSQGVGTDPYSRGAAYLASPPTAPWMPVPIGPPDFAFKTYVVPQPTQTPTGAAPPTGKRGAALKKCKKKHSKKARRKCRKKAKRLPV